MPYTRKRELGIGPRPLADWIARKAAEALGATHDGRCDWAIWALARFSKPFEPDEGPHDEAVRARIADLNRAGYSAREPREDERFGDFQRNGVRVYALPDIIVDGQPPCHEEIKTAMPRDVDVFQAAVTAVAMGTNRASVVYAKKSPSGWKFQPPIPVKDVTLRVTRLFIDKATRVIAAASPPQRCETCVGCMDKELTESVKAEVDPFGYLEEFQEGLSELLKRMED